MPVSDVNKNKMLHITVFIGKKIASIETTTKISHMFKQYKPVENCKNLKIDDKNAIFDFIQLFFFYCFSKQPNLLRW